MKAKSVQLVHAVTIPGTRILGDISIQPEKHPEAVITVESHGILVESHGAKAFVPFSNIKSIILKEEEEDGRSKQASKKS